MTLLFSPLPLNPTLSKTLLSTAAFSLKCSRKSQNFFSLAFKSKKIPTHFPLPSTMPAAAAGLHLLPSSSAAATTNAVSLSQKLTATVTTGLTNGFSAASSCLVYGYSAERAIILMRAWVVFKESRGGYRLAWAHTAFDKGVSADCTKESNDGCESGVEKEKGEKRLRLNRRQKGLAVSCDATAAEPIGNPNLLTILGIGPRNLRKLAEKSIAGVAELKRLYKDKVS